MSDLVSDALEFWRGLDLTAKQTQFAAQTASLRAKEEELKASRQVIASATRRFKKLDDDTGQLKATAMTLIKQYQGELESAWKRGRLAEKMFLNCIQSLKSAPDPAIALAYVRAEENAADLGLKSTDARVNALARRLQQENEDLKEKLEEADEEFALLKNQDVTIRRLEARLQEHERSLEKRIAEATLQAQVDFDEERNRFATDAQEQERLMESRVQAVKEQLATANREHSRTQARVLQLTQAQEHKDFATESESAVFDGQFERLSAQVARLQHENDTLRASSSFSSSSIPAQPSTSAQLDLDMLQDELKRLRTRNEHLEDESRAARLKHQEELAGHTQRVSEAELDLARSLAATSELRQTIKNLPTKQEFRAAQKQLMAYEAVHFNIAGAEDGEGAGLRFTSTEQIFLEKTKKLENEALQLKRELETAVASRVELKARIETADKQLVEAKALIAKLEESLDQATTTKSGVMAPGSPSSASLHQKGKSQGNMRDDSMLLGVVSGIIDANASAGATASSPAPNASPGAAASPSSKDADGQAGSILDIVTGQRDRYRERVEQLEERVLSLKQQIETLYHEKSELKAENLKVYESLQYVRSQSTSSSATAASSSSSSLLVTGASKPARQQTRDVENQYGKLNAEYQRTINPFNAFKKKAAQKSLSKLPWQERMLYSVGGWCISGKGRRTILLIYSLILHMLVFFTMAEHTFWAHC
jgi:homeobox protein cut-like